MNFTAPTPNPEKRKRGRPRKNASNFANDNLNQSSNSKVENDAMSTINENLQIKDVAWEQEIEDNSIQLEGDIQKFDDIDTKGDLLIEGENLDNPTIFLESEADLVANENPEELQLPTPVDGKVNLNKPEINFKISTTIHIVDGEKGGAGKSFVSRAFIEYCAAIGHDVSIVDADTSNQDIVNIYDNVETAYFSDDDKLAKEADTIFDLAFENSVIVNLPAQVYSKVTNWIKDNDLTEIGKENSIKFVKWFVCTGGVDSVNFFLQSLEDLGDSMLHVFVRNLGLCDDWKYIQEMPEFVAAQTKYNFIVMDFPKFPFWERNMVDRLGVTFEAAIAHPDLKVISKQRVKNFLKEAYAAFAGTGIVQ
ncbi:cobalamin biosynthesis protein CobQ [Calothrix sp. FACHB-1219]|uniref:cobalamin biosynthesis protein CobQ n=1 Tax=unclassified Calothrix TaxID=2619626 RepID=UPI001686903E|nr:MULTISPECIES: cobalamin biosynthesis protein CobQ [unclassified Calothrix]MBD2205588.1 cobalamin biosynthesis protein CobQ [Calothrix sp. FACHB-168]MBD2220251.1 cobalamin biosynthesis protein CobQ [Calothrix sp. FACHB-1219]